MPGNIRRRGNRWQASVEVPRRDGKRSRVYRTFKSEREANYFVSERHLAVATGSFIPPSACTVAEAFEQWAETRRQDSSTRRVYDSYAARTLAEFGRLPIQSLSTPMLERFVAQLATAPRLDRRPGRLSDRTIDHVIRQLKAFLAWAKNHDYIARDPAAPLPRVARIQGREMTILDVDRTRVMLDAARGTLMEGPLWLGVMAGLRRGEALGLGWSDVDLAAGRIRVAHSLSMTPDGPRLGPTKTLSSRRTVRLSDDTIGVLARIRSEQEARFGLLPDYVCPSTTGGAWHPSRFSHDFARFLVDARMRPMRFHDLRHTHASQLIAADVHIKAISTRLGHANIQITMNLYGHLLPGVEEMAVAKLQHLFDRGRSQPPAA